MFRSASRCLPRQPLRQLRPSAQRHLSTAPPHLKSRSWKNSAARWTLAAAGIYYYNTSTLFAEEPSPMLRDPPGPEEELPTLQSLSPSSRFQPPHPSDKPSVAPTPKSTSPPSIDPKAPSTLVDADPQEAPGAEGLEEEAAQQGAFNEETGEINWDCPCLGGMAHGPCGEEFREAFSCFVFSKEEPKGMDCVDKFKGMQNCFREHPEIYAAELADDEEDDNDNIGVDSALARDESSKVAGALPEDSHNVAAAESAKQAALETKDSIADAAQSKFEDAKEVAGRVERETRDVTAKLSERAYSARDQVAEKIEGIKEGVETYISPEQGGHDINKPEGPNEGKKDGQVLPGKTQLSSRGIDDVKEEVSEIVPKAAVNAKGENKGKKTEK